MSLIINRALLLIALLAIVALILPGIAEGRKSGPAWAEARVVSNQAINSSLSSAKRFRQARFSPQFLTEIEQEMNCWKPIIESTTPLLKKEDPLTALFTALAFAGLIEIDASNNIINQQRPLITAERQLAVSQVKRWQAKTKFWPSQAVLRAWRARTRQHDRAQQFAASVNIDACQLADLLEDNDGYQSLTRMFFLIDKWLQLSAGAIFDDSGSKAEEKDQQRIKRGIRIMRQALSPKKSKRVRGFARDPIVSLFSTFRNQYQKEYPSFDYFLIEGPGGIRQRSDISDQRGTIEKLQQRIKMLHRAGADDNN